MNLSKLRLALTVMLFWGVCGSVIGQIDSVRFLVKYDTSLCRFDAYVVIRGGSATLPQHRAQFNAQYSIVVPTGSSVSLVASHNPIRDNINYNGTVPATWTMAPPVSAPAADPSNDFYSITPTLSPTAYYNDLMTGDSVKLFSFTVNPVNSCASLIRPFETGVDPASNEPGMGGGDFSCGFTVGGFSQLYVGNLDNVLPPNPVISAIPMCSEGLEIDLTASTSSCQDPLSYAWTGPDSYSSTTEDVSISPAGEINSGTYFVTVTDNFGCSSEMSVDAIAKPSAGNDELACDGDQVTLQGSEPNSGTWSADTNNPAGATLNTGSNGSATVDISVSSSTSFTFIYTNQTCSDSMTITASVSDAGPDPNSVTCFSQGSTTMAGVGSGTWSVGSGSAGTATISDPNNATTTVTGFSDPGQYNMVWTVNGCEDIAVITVGDDCSCVISNNILTPFNPSTICGTSGNILVDGGAVTQSGTYLWEYSLDGAVFATATGTSDAEDYTTPDHTEGEHRYRRIFTNDMGIICSDTSNVITLIVANKPDAPSGLVASPNPTCYGNTINFSVTNNPIASYNWTASSNDAGLAASITNSTTMDPVSSGTYDVSVTQTVNACESDPSTVSVVVNPTPPTPGANITANNPTVCGGSDGSIEISGLLNNHNYSVSYDQSGQNQNVMITSSAGGVLQISGLVAGTYSNISLTNEFGCSSGTSNGSETLSDPNAPPAPADISASPNPACLGETVTITVEDNPGAIFNWSSPSATAGLGSSTSNSITMVATAPGQHLIEVSQTVNGCTSVASGIDVLINGTPPTPDASTVSGNDPTSCGGSDGTIMINGLDNLVSYVVNYEQDGNAQMNTITTNTNGELIITGLPQGTYTNFSLSNFTNCSSGIYAGPVTLTDPNSPPAPSNLTAVPPAGCLGDMIQLSVDDNAGATFNWTVSSPNATLGGGTTNSNTLTSNTEGLYTVSVSQTVAGCTSPNSSLNVQFQSVPPDFTGTSFTNPTVCGGADGSISLEGVENNTTYTLTFSVNNTNQSIGVTSNASGTIIVPGLSAGVYENFQLANVASCTNASEPGPINLVDPSAPAAPTGLAAVPDRVCLGGTFNLSVDNNASATYTWSAAPGNNGLISSTTNSTTMTPTEVGTYNVSVFQTVAGCSSPATMISVIVDPLPDAPDPANITFVNPTVCTGADGSITIGGYDAFRTYTVDYKLHGVDQQVSIGTDANGNIVIPNLTSGSYTEFTITDTGGCTSLPYAGPVSLTDPGAPSAPTNFVGVPNPSCLGTQVNLSVDNNPSATYTWSSSSPNAGLGSSSTNSNSMTATTDGVYTISVSQTIAGCTSPPATLDVTVHPIPDVPVAGDFTSTDPSACGLDDGSITIGGFSNNTNYTVQYELNGAAQVVNIVSNNSGEIILNDLALGAYTNFEFSSAGNCFSNPFTGTINLVGPAPPPAPSGLIALPNPSCLGEVVTLSVTDNPQATYEWTTSNQDAGLNVNTSNEVTMLAINAGTYTISVTQTVNGCTSAASTIDVVVHEVPEAPIASDFMMQNPSACLADDGEISIWGYVPNTIYTVHYTFNGDSRSFTATSNGVGAIYLNNLVAGVYANFSIESDQGCISPEYGGMIQLVEPDMPDAPLGLQAIPNPICLGETAQLTVENTVNATFQWMASGPGAGIESSPSNETIMTPTVPGIYTISVIQIINGCTSPAASIEVMVVASCLNPDFGVTYKDTLLTGQLSTNDRSRDQSEYVNISGDVSNPSSDMPMLNIDGSYSFTTSNVGEYHYIVTVCSTNQTIPCYDIPLVITVLDSESEDNPPVANHDYMDVLSEVPTVVSILNNDHCESSSNCSLSGASLIDGPYHGSYNIFTGMYTSDNGYIGKDSFRYEVCQSPTVDPINCDQEWVYIDVFPSSSQFYVHAMDDYNTTPRNIDLTANTSIGVASNDFDPSNSIMRVTEFTETVQGKGTLTMSADGSYSFVPFTDYVGPVDFAYEICRSGTSGLCDSATLHLLVQPRASTGIIGDYLWEDMDGNGLQDFSEPGIEDVIVMLFDEYGDMVNSTKTNNTGYYQFMDVPVGNYYIEYMMSEEFTPTFDHAGANQQMDSNVDGSHGENTTPMFEVVGGEEDQSIDGGYYKCVKIGSFVWYDTNENDIMDPFENGINGLLIRLYKMENGAYVLWDETLTSGDPSTPSGDGWFEFCTAPGEYYIEVVMPPYGLVLVKPFRGGSIITDSDIDHSNGPSTSASFTLRSGESKTDLGAGYYPMAVAGNSVWRDDNHNGIQEPFEEKVSGVVVKAYDAETHRMLGEGVTDMQGLYQIDYLESRDVYLKFDIPSGYHATVANAANDHEDSDVDHSFGFNTTNKYTLNPGDHVDNIDLGIAFGILPVDWISINGSIVENGNLIEWTTANEVNVKGYKIERRSSEDSKFEIISTSNIKGLGSSINNYHFVDEKIGDTETFIYRVLQEDYDGNFSYSPEVSIVRNGKEVIQVFPNPTRDRVSIELDNQENSVLISLYDVQGKLVKSLVVYPEDINKNTIDLDLNSLESGVYNMVLNYGVNLIKHKIIKI